MKKILSFILAFLFIFPFGLSFAACGGGGGGDSGGTEQTDPVTPTDPTDPTEPSEPTEPTEKEVYERYPSREMIFQMTMDKRVDNFSAGFLGLTSAVTDVKVNGETTDSITIDENITVSDGIIGEDLEVTVETETEIVVTRITVVDFAIRTKADMIFFMENFAGVDSDVYVVMVTDINFGGDTYNYVINNVPWYRGVFNGRGRKFFNVKFNTPFIANLKGENAVIKNLAITEAQATGRFAPLCLRIDGLVENIFIECDLFDMHSDDAYCQPLAYWVENQGVDGKVGVMRNVVAVFTNFYIVSDFSMILRYVEGPMTNVYVSITLLEPRTRDIEWYYQHNNAGVMTNCELFNGVNKLKNKVNANNSAVTDAFDTSDSGCWKFDNSGLLTFKSV